MLEFSEEARSANAHVWCTGWNFTHIFLIIIVVGGKHHRIKMMMMMKYLVECMSCNGWNNATSWYYGGGLACSSGSAVGHARDATTSSKLGVPFLGYYYPSIEKIRSTQFGAVGYIITLFIKKLRENVGSVQIFGVRTPDPPVVAPTGHVKQGALCLGQLVHAGIPWSCSHPAVITAVTMVLPYFPSHYPPLLHSTFLFIELEI